jgi:hypothetical protein
MIKVNPESEAQNILHTLTAGDKLSALTLMGDQFSLLQSRCQALLGVATVVITISGIAGSKIVPVDLYAGFFIVTGLLTTLLAAFMLLLGILKINWVTYYQSEEFTDILAHLIYLRNRKTLWYKRAVICLIFGLVQFSICFVCYFLLANFSIKLFV